MNSLNNAFIGLTLHKTTKILKIHTDYVALLMKSQRHKNANTFITPYHPRYLK